MTLETLAGIVRDAGYFAQVRPWGGAVSVEAAHWDEENDAPRAPLIHTFQDRAGRWVLSVFGEEYVQVPDVKDVPAASLDMLREMGNCLELPSAVIDRYHLVRLDPAEFRTDDE